MPTFAPSITHHPTSDFPVKVALPGANATWGFRDEDQAVDRVGRYEPIASYSTRITSNAAEMRHVLAPLTEIAGRDPDTPVLDTVRIHTLADGTTRFAATDRFIIMRGKLNAVVLGEPVDVTIRSAEARTILDLLGAEPAPVVHCESCYESGAHDGCDREQGKPTPVILDIGPGTIKVTVGGYYKTAIEFDTGQTPEYWDKSDSLVDELTRPDELDVIGYACNPALVPECEGITLAPRLSGAENIRWGIVDREGMFDGVLMPVLEKGDG